jgi:hypothetical protein
MVFLIYDRPTWKTRLDQFVVGPSESNDVDLCQPAPLREDCWISLRCGNISSQKGIFPQEQPAVSDWKTRK